MEETVFAFDVGIGSLGIAVRKGNEILEARSLLIPPEFASIKDQRSRRRQYRTRIAHKKREEWLKDQCHAAGIEVLEGRTPGDRKEGIPPRKGDPRLEREFAEPGDNTVYTSCLLRILLLCGEKLEGWQVYKALHSAMQRRGYDSSIPWRRASKKEDEEKESKESVVKFEEELKTIMGGREEYMYPCYYDAFKMGLWDPGIDRLIFKQNQSAERSRGYTPPRAMVEKEFRTLLESAAKQFPALSGKADFIMYGPAEKPYASFDADIRREYGVKEGGEWDWQGALAQKIPRFDNRIVDKCALIPRYNVCRATDLLVIQVTFLMKLMNIRYYDTSFNECRLTPADIRTIFDTKKSEGETARREASASGLTGDDLIGKIADTYKYTARPWKSWLKTNKNGIPVVNHEVIEPPKTAGRSRFCRPALRLLRNLILSGESPHKFYSQMIEEIINDDPKKGLIIKDLEFLLDMPDDWNTIYIPQMSLAEKYADESGSAVAAIRKLIGKQNSPVIRHRMEVFRSQLDELARRYGVPDRVVIEFVREDFMGPKAKAEYERAMRENRKKREDAKQKAAELGASDRGDVLKLMLLKQQGYQCIYTGENLSESDLGALEIDHSVPRHGKYSGSDSMYNKVITKSLTNREKADRTPFEFITAGGAWLAYCDRVKSHLKELGKKKVRLLTAEHPEEVDDKYTALAETAWITRLARDIVCITFGWQPGAKGEEQRVFVVPGALTARARRERKIDSLLASGETDPDAIEKKNREDNRHHALDAMVLSFITQTRPSLPEGIGRDYFRTLIESVIPTQIAFEKPVLEETIYARRVIGGKEAAVKRIKLADLKTVKKNVKKILDPSIRGQIERKLDTKPNEEEWVSFIGTLHQSADHGGSRVVRAAVEIGSLEEYMNLSKNDGKGQYRRGAKSHGQYIYEDERGKIRVRQVYVFESKRRVHEDLIKQGMQIIGFFTAGCLVEIPREFDFNGRLIPVGTFRLGSIWSNGFVKIDSPFACFKNPVSIAALLAAGFRRVR